MLLLHRADARPGESVDMPVVFYVDPAIADDRDVAKLGTITLSYTFYPARAAGAGLPGRCRHP
jgi:cytochrome c oxidase assembly protein subunit 11